MGNKPDGVARRNLCQQVALAFGQGPRVQIGTARIEDVEDVEDHRGRSLGPSNVRVPAEIDAGLQQLKPGNAVLVQGADFAVELERLERMTGQGLDDGRILAGAVKAAATAQLHLAV